MNKLKNIIISAVVAFGFVSATAFADGHKYTIDNSNYTEYTDMLSAGQVTMFSAYPDTYKMHVYETGADCKAPPAVTSISQSNGQMVNDN